MITVISPSVRPDGLKIVERCLKRQDFTDWEWLVIAPKRLSGDIQALSLPCTLLEDPPKRSGDFWSLCKAWNLGYSTARGELIVNIQDMIWFPPDTLGRFWRHYQNNPKSLVTAVGDHYERQDDRGEPINKVWQDERDRSKFAEISNSELEMTMCSVPKQAILDCGGVDEEYDKGPGVQEKEMGLRIKLLGYQLFIDPTIEYKAIKHARLTDDWDDKYWSITAPMYKKHVEGLFDGTRNFNVGYVK